MEKLKKTELTLLALIGSDTRYTVYRCPEHGMFATMSDRNTCHCCKKELKPLDVAASIDTKKTVYALPG